MKKIKFLDILNSSSDLNSGDILELESVINEFPYFQAARAVYLKGLKTEKSFKYNKTLKNTAAYTSERQILFDLITSDDFNQNKISEHIQHNNEGLKNITVEHYNDISDSNEKTKNQKDEEFILKMGQPLEFDKNDSYSFSEWLNLTKISPIDRSNDSNQRKQKNINIIDSFIDKKPRIAKLKSPKSLENLAEKSVLKPDDLMTETLARIYLEQKNYDKAINSFKILSLKYPEKSSLFANQIKAIKKLLEK